MALDASELARRREMASGNGVAEDAPGRPKTEEVIKMYSDDERMRVISKEAVKIKIGTPEKEVLLYPLSLRQLLGFLPKVKSVLGPVLILFKDRRAGDPAIPIAAIVEALAERIDELPEIVTVILSRGNAEIDHDWLMDHFDVVPDMQTILPIFLKQNGLDKLLNLGKQVPPSQDSSKRDDGSSNARTEQLDPTQTTASPQP